MRHPFAMKNGERIAVIRPDDPDLAKRLADEHMRTQSERSPEENEQHFNAILSAQNYSFVGFLSMVGKPARKLLDKNGWAIGTCRPWDSLVPEGDINRAKDALDALEKKWTEEGVGTTSNPCGPEHPAHFRCDKFCLCSTCGVVALCTPKHDFTGGTDAIRCPSCYATWLNENAGKAVPPIGSSDDRIVGTDLGNCPCGASIGVSLVGASEHHVTHGLPVCSQFAGMSPDEYVAWVRRQRMD